MQLQLLKEQTGPMQANIGYKMPPKPIPKKIQDRSQGPPTQIRKTEANPHQHLNYTVLKSQQKEPLI